VLLAVRLKHIARHHRDSELPGSSEPLHTVHDPVGAVSSQPDSERSEGILVKAFCDSVYAGRNKSPLVSVRDIEFIDAYLPILSL
jgi:hypothetical protein